MTKEEKDYNDACEAAFYEECLCPKTPEDFAHNDRLRAKLKDLRDKTFIAMAKEKVRVVKIPKNTIFFSVFIEKHFFKGDINGDYTDVIVRVDDEVAVQYGDSYHDKGKERAQGFVDGLRYGLEMADLQMIADNLDIDDR